MRMGKINLVLLAEQALHLDQVQKIRIVDILLEQTKRNLEIIVPDLMINHKIPAHFKNDC